MYKILLATILLQAAFVSAKAQNTSQTFDTIQFSRNLELADWLVEYDYFNQLSLNYLKRNEDISKLEWFSFKQNQIWHTVGGTINNNHFSIIKHVFADSLYNISDFTGTCDSATCHAAGHALVTANRLFGVIRDSSSMYFSSFVHFNPDNTISAWFLPALQPSGQVIYGCEWEYVFDNTGNKMLRQNALVNTVTGMWIGQPRELWLNYRNTSAPTVGSIFFTLSYGDYFTRIRIDTQFSISTRSKDKNEFYTWTHKIK